MEREILKTIIMAIIGKGIFGGIRGKISNIVGNAWKGRDVLAGWSEKPRPTPTLSQEKQRAIFNYARFYASNTRQTSGLFYSNKKSENIGNWAFAVKCWENAVNEFGYINYHYLKFAPIRLNTRSIVAYNNMPYIKSFRVGLNEFVPNNYDSYPIVFAVFYCNVSQKYVKEYDALIGTNYNNIIIEDQELRNNDVISVFAIGCVSKLQFQSQISISTFTYSED